MNRWRLAVTVMTVLFPVLDYAANPFLDANNDQPVSARFRGTEWSDDRIVMLNDEDNATAATKISAMDKPPEFEPNDIYGITSGSFEHQEGEWKATIKLKGDLCIYDASHPSGHFKKIVWKKGVGLVEYASGYGARADGYRLKREVTSRK